MRNKNHNHFIAKVYDQLNDPRKESPILSPYFDGTQAQAIRHFCGLELLKTYRKRPHRYVIYISANPLELDYNC